MLKLFKLVIAMFNYGLLDHIRNFQGIFERIYIRHRLLDDLTYQENDRLTAANSNSHNQYVKMVEEMKDLVEQSPNMKLLFMS